MKPLRKLRAFFRREKLDAEMTEEMRAHLELQARENENRGMSRAEARHAAQRAFGGMEQIKEHVREQRGWLWLEQTRQDLRFAARTFLKAPGFTAVAVLTLALGIGVNTSLFSVVYGVLLAPYPYVKSNEIWATTLIDTKTGRPWGLHQSDYLGISKLPAVDSAMATSMGTALLTGGVNPEYVNAPRLSATAFRFLGVPALLGRGLTEADFSAAGEPLPVTVLTFQLWQRLFNGDPGVLGRTLILDEKPHTIVGVMPPRFVWYTTDGLWLPLPATELERNVRPLVRLKPGVASEVASQQLLALLKATAQETPGRLPKEGFATRFTNYLDVTVASGEMRASLHLLLYAVGFLLLIACTNVANLQLARAAARGREIAVRLAMGASRGRLLRQLLTESVALALVGGAGGVLLASWLTHVIVALLPGSYVPSEARVTMNEWVLLFSVGISVVTGVLFGLAPGLQCTKPDLNVALKQGGQGAAAGAAGNRTRQLLVIAEVALSIVLLVGASLAIRGFVELQRIDRGFRYERMVVVGVPLSAKRYATLEQRNAFAREFLERLRGLPGVAGATLGQLPGHESGSGVTIVGQPKTLDNVGLNYIDADYLPTLGLSLRGGRNLTADDVPQGARVALITESAAKLWADGKDPIGRTIAVDSLIGGGVNNLAPRGAVKEVVVVGIVADVRSRDKRRPPQPLVLVPYTLRGPVNRAFALRAQGEPAALVNAVRAELRAMDATLPMVQPQIVEEYFAKTEEQPRFNLVLFASLAAVALGLAAAGIYSVLSYTVAQRTPEIGVRMALGASPGDIVGLVVRSGGRLLLVGVVIGVSASLALTQIVQSQIFNVPLLDPLALVAAALVLGAVALLACWLPARRAARVDPLVALRAE